MKKAIFKVTARNTGSFIKYIKFFYSNFYIKQELCHENSNKWESRYFHFMTVYHEANAVINNVTKL